MSGDLSTLDATGTAELVRRGDVTPLEAVAGDWTRGGEALPGSTDTDMGLAYLTQNAGKRSVTIDLKTEAGLKLVERLIAGADIFVENFKPGVAARLGLSFEAVRRLSPTIVYCSISAYGQDGRTDVRPS